MIYKPLRKSAMKFTRKKNHHQKEGKTRREILGQLMQFQKSRSSKLGSLLPQSYLNTSFFLKHQCTRSRSFSPYFVAIFLKLYKRMLAELIFLCNNFLHKVLIYDVLQKACLYSFVSHQLQPTLSSLPHKSYNQYNEISTII